MKESILLFILLLSVIRSRANISRDYLPPEVSPRPTEPTQCIPGTSCLEYIPPPCSPNEPCSLLPPVMSQSLEYLPPFVESFQPLDQRPPIFTVVAPFDIRPGKPYNIYVRGFNLDKTITVFIRLLGKTDSEKSVNETRVVEISPEVPRSSISIDTLPILKGSYSLFVEADGYSENRTLTYITQKCTFFIQFNKAIHQPDETLQYRIFAIDSETNAVSPTEPNSIKIFDPSGNIVESITNVDFKNGKYENKFKFSTKNKIGKWTLKFECDEENTEKNFEVAEYTLPVLSGKITVPKNYPIKYRKLPVTIDVKNVFGGYVDGSAKVAFIRDGVTLFSININSGSATFDVDIINDLKLPSLSGPVNFEATLKFHDSFTDSEVTDQTSFTIVPNIYTIDIFDADRYLKPGSSYNFNVILKKYDDTPAPAGTKILITPNNQSNPQQTLLVNSDGIATISIDVPRNLNHMEIEISSEDSKPIKIEASAFSSDDESYLNIDVLSKEPKLNERINVKLTSSDKVDFAMVHITSKGVLLKSLTVYFDSDSNDDHSSKTVKFSITPTIFYAPEMQIFAYYINRSGSIVTGQTSVIMNKKTFNYLDIRPTVNAVDPGSDLKINIQSYVNSTVSLMAVDKRSLLIKDDASIDKQSVLNSLNKYSSCNMKSTWNNSDSHDRSNSITGLHLFTNNPKKTSFSSTNSDTEQNLASSKSSTLISNQASSELETSKNLRVNFGETFLWQDVDIRNSIHDDVHHNQPSQNGFETITVKVPDSISKYVIYGVSMSSTNGMGLSENAPTVSTFLPFFISVEFPFSVKRDETFVQDIFIYSYLIQSQNVEVKVTKNSRYEAVDLETYGWTESDNFYTKSITSTVGQHSKFQFALRPKSLGFIPFEISARGPLAGDSLKKQIRVDPDGSPQTIKKIVYVEIDKAEDVVEEDIKFDLPSSAAPDTVDVTASVSGDIFDTFVDNLDKFIREPNGSYEQTTLSFILNVAIYQNLQSANKLLTNLKTTLENYIATGYKNLQRYQSLDGSFSTFLNEASSTWVTAFITQYLSIAADITTIDSGIVIKSADYVAANQNSDGSFNESSQLIRENLPAESGSQVGLTAFCSIMFSSILSRFPQYLRVRNKATTYLETQFSNDSSTYDLGISSYALQLAGSDKATDAYNLFYARRTESSNTIYWKASKKVSDLDVNSNELLDVKLTSYGLMTALRRPTTPLSLLKMSKYIMNQSNIIKQNIDSHDSSLALQALSQYSRTMSSNRAVDVTLTPDVGTAFTVNVTASNAMTLQTFQLNSAVRKMSVRGSSTSGGYAVVTLTCNYYQESANVSSQFDVRDDFNVESIKRH